MTSRVSLRYEMAGGALSHTTPTRVACVFSNQYGMSTRAWGPIDAPTVTVLFDVKPSTLTPSKPMNGTPLPSRNVTRSGENGVNDGPIAELWSLSTSFSA